MISLSLLIRIDNSAQKEDALGVWAMNGAVEMHNGRLSPPCRGVNLDTYGGNCFRVLPQPCQPQPSCGTMGPVEVQTLRYQSRCLVWPGRWAVRWGCGTQPLTYGNSSIIVVVTNGLLEKMLSGRLSAEVVNNVR